MNNGADLGALEALMEFDCREPRRRYYNLTGFDHSGVVLREEEGSRQWRPIVPGSQDDASRDFICSGGRSGSSRSYGSVRPFLAGRALLRAAGARDPN